MNIRTQCGTMPETLESSTGRSLDDWLETPRALGRAGAARRDGDDASRGPVRGARASPRWDSQQPTWPHVANMRRLERIPHS